MAITMWCASLGSQVFDDVLRDCGHGHYDVVLRAAHVPRFSGACQRASSGPHALAAVALGVALLTFQRCVRLALRVAPVFNSVACAFFLSGGASLQNVVSARYHALAAVTPDRAGSVRVARYFLDDVVRRFGDRTTVRARVFSF